MLCYVTMIFLSKVVFIMCKTVVTYIFCEVIYCFIFVCYADLMDLAFILLLSVVLCMSAV